MYYKILSMKKRADELKVIAEWNANQAFIFDLTDDISSMKNARNSKQGEEWGTYILSCYLAIKADLESEEIEKCEQFRKDLMAELATMRNNPKRIALTPRLYGICWEYEAYIRLLLVEKGLMNTKKEQYPEDTV